MRKKLNLLFGLVLIISMIILTGCGGSGKTEEKNPYSDDDDYYTFHCVKSDSE